MIFSSGEQTFSKKVFPGGTWVDDNELTEDPFNVGYIRSYQITVGFEHLSTIASKRRRDSRKVYLRGRDLGETRYYEIQFKFDKSFINKLSNYQSLRYSSELAEKSIAYSSVAHMIEVVFRTGPSSLDWQ